MPKRSPDGKPKLRFCVDLRAISSITKCDSYPPLVLEETTSLFGPQNFSVLVCYSGFWQFSIQEEHKERKGFTVPFGHYEFNRLPIGMWNSPANFQHTDTVVKDIIGFQLCSLLILFSKSAEEHDLRIENVLQSLKKLSPATTQKMRICASFELSEIGVSNCADKVNAVKEYPTPKNVKDVRTFLGLATLY